MISNVGKLIRRVFSTIPTNEIIQDLKYSLSKIARGRRDIKKSITVAIIGKANTGKSTLINAMMGMNICAASMKPQTTMQYQRVFHVQGDTQVVLLDTPGIISAKTKKKYDIKDKADVFTVKQLKVVDLVAVVVDASDKYTKSILPSEVKRLIKTFPSETEMVLILNKVDQVKLKINLLKYVDKLCSDMKFSCDENLSSRSFSRVFMVSALENDGIDTVINYIQSVAKEKNNYESPGRLTDHSDHKIVQETVRAALLEHLKYNIPYECFCEVEYLQEDISGKVNIIVLIRCPTDSVKRIVSNFYLLEKISFLCKENLQKVFRRDVFLKLNVIGPKKNK